MSVLLSQNDKFREKSEYEKRFIDIAYCIAEAHML